MSFHVALPPPAPRPLILFLDFDGTLTEHDTLAALAAVPSACVSGGDAPGDGTTAGGGGGGGDGQHARGSRCLGCGGSAAGPTHVGSGGRGPESGGAWRAIAGDDERTDRAAIGQEKEQRKADFAALTSRYRADLHAHTQRYVPTAEARTTVAHELAWLESVQSVERASIARVEASGLFRGLTRETIREGAFEAVQGRRDPAEGGMPRVRVRSFADVCVRAVVEGGGEARVVSVNWSRTWIRAALSAAWAEGGAETVPVADVAANELDWSGRITGYHGGLVVTAGDKRGVVRGVIQRWEGEGGCRSVYVGDSVTDLGALLAVDVGICLRGERWGASGGREGEMGGSQRELKDVLERCGVGCEWLGGWREERRGEGKRLWWVRGFKEIWESGILGEGWEGNVGSTEPGQGNPLRET